jgi:hypothetical protein
MPDTKEKLYSVPEARQQLGNIAAATFYKLLREERLHVVKIGSRTFVPESEIARFCRENTRPLVPAG